MIYASENPRHRAFYRFSRNNYEANIIIDLKTYQLFYLSIYKPFGYLFVRIYVYIYSWNILDANIDENGLQNWNDSAKHESSAGLCLRRRCNNAS